MPKLEILNYQHDYFFKAYFWLSIAIANGAPNLKQARNECCDKMTQEERDNASPSYIEAYVHRLRIESAPGNIAIKQ